MSRLRDSGSEFTLDGGLDAGQDRRGAQEFHGSHVAGDVQRVGPLGFYWGFYHFRRGFVVRGVTSPFLALVSLPCFGFHGPGTCQPCSLLYSYPSCVLGLLCAPHRRVVIEDTRGLSCSVHPGSAVLVPHSVQVRLRREGLPNWPGSLAPP